MRVPRWLLAITRYSTLLLVTGCAPSADPLADQRSEAATDRSLHQLQSRVETGIGAQPADEEPDQSTSKDALAVLGRALEALGGERNFSKLRTGRVRTKVHANFAPLGKGDLECEDSFSLPYQLKRQVQGKIAGEQFNATYVYNNDQSWVKLGTGPVRRQPHPGVLTTFPYSLVSEMLKVKNGDYALSLLDAFDTNGQALPMVRVERNGTWCSDTVFDPETGLALTSAKAVPDAVTGEWIYINTHYDQYVEIQGLMIPHVMTSLRENGEEHMKVNVLSIELLDRIDDSVFARPGDEM